MPVPSLCVTSYVSWASFNRGCLRTGLEKNSIRPGCTPSLESRLKYDMAV